MAAASKSDPRLLDLFEIDHEFGEAKIGKSLLESVGAPLRSFINLDRQYAARWSPLKLELLSHFLEIESIPAEHLEVNSPNAIFDLPPTSYALVTLDLRHVPAQSYDWTYGEDWSISFTLVPDLNLGDLAKPTPMPE